MTSLILFARVISVASVQSVCHSSGLSSSSMPCKMVANRKWTFSNPLRLFDISVGSVRFLQETFF